MNGDRLPRAGAIQELATVWKQLWEWRRRERRLTSHRRIVDITGLGPGAVPVCRRP